MKNTFTKHDLQTGDIIVARNGELGIVLKEIGVIVYQNNGADDLDNFDDDLKSVYDGNEFDIMAVYRDGVPSFQSYLDSDLIYERDDEFVEAEDKLITETKPVEENKPKGRVIGIMTQAFYGNRTLTEVYEKNLDRFILGYLDDSFKVSSPIDRTIVRIPHTENLVIIYNKYQEEETLQYKEKYYLEDNYVLKPLAIIPELNLELYSRCIVCRMNEQGELESLQDDDYKKFIQYLAA